PDEKPTVENHVFEISTLTDCLEQADGLPGDESAHQRVPWPNQRRRRTKIELSPLAGHGIVPPQVIRHASSMGFSILRRSSRKLPKSERDLACETRIHSTFELTLSGPLLAQGRGMQETPPVDGNVFIWSLSILVISLILA